MTGRPSDYSDAMADHICTELVDGRKSLRTICKEPGMPSAGTVFRWLADERYAKFQEQYARAREAQAEAMADEIVDIADNGTNDYMADGTYNGDSVQRSKLRVDARKWVASKLKPKKYGDRQLIGSDPDNPLPTGFSVKLVKGEG